MLNNLSDSLCKLLIRTKFAHTFKCSLKMKYCALILMASLPTVWLVVGIGLIVITVVSLLLFVFKWHEVSMLKKEVFELRDTMRMMRYEEANLSRMLHTVEKSEEGADVPFVEEEPTVVAPVFEEQVSEEHALEEQTLEEPVEEIEKIEEPISSVGTEEVQDEPVVENQQVEEVVVTDEVVEKIEDPIEETLVADIPVVVTPVVEETIVETSIVEALNVEPIVVIEEPVVPKPRKQAINERRPAIPNDLFAAWFEENDPTDPEKSEEEVVAEIEKESVEQAQEIQAEEPIVETSVVDASVVEEAKENSEAMQSEVEDIAQPKETIELSKEDERFCRKLERIVNARMRNPNLNIDVIASQFGIGRTNFYRKVRELMDISPNDYLRKCRMERAAELLQSTDLNIAEICAQVGIPDAQYFSRVFKAHFGMPPSAYREQK